MQILLQGLSAKSEILSFSSTEQYTISSLYSLYNINTDDAYFISNGKIIDVSEDLSHYNDCIIHCHYRLLGGKGGFGSLLKGQPAVKKQTKNFDACRDISGRRLRHVNQEKQIMEWQQKKENARLQLQEIRNKQNTYTERMKNGMPGNSSIAGLLKRNPSAVSRRHVQSFGEYKKELLENRKKRNDREK